MKIHSYVEKVLDRLHENGYEAYSVGGCVRDMIMGATINDYDITTSATPDEMKKAFAGYTVIETGIKHGTLTFLYDKEPIVLFEVYYQGKSIDPEKFYSMNIDELQ